MDLKNVTSIHADQSINKCFLKLDLIYDQHQWERIIGSIIWNEDFIVLRVKGIVRVKDSEFVFSL